MSAVDHPQKLETYTTLHSVRKFASIFIEWKSKAFTMGQKSIFGLKTNFFAKKYYAKLNWGIFCTKNWSLPQCAWTMKNDWKWFTLVPKKHTV